MAKAPHFATRLRYRCFINISIKFFNKSTHSFVVLINFTKKSWVLSIETYS